MASSRYPLLGTGIDGITGNGDISQIGKEKQWRKSVTIERYLPCERALFLWLEREAMIEEVVYKPIGIIHTPYKHTEGTPIQGCFAPRSRGEIVLFPEYAGGISNIEGFSHLILLYHFHKACGYELLTKPFLDKEKKGIFSIRYFARPNPIGLSVVTLLGVRGNILDIGEVDMFDGTPLLDIKPYVPQFDIKNDVRDGWYPNASEKEKFKIEE
jgi:tRNA-Thr(GGU) m(6)t(6)A37 methyltransferase TsaA